MRETLATFFWSLRQRSGLFEWLVLLVLVTTAFRAGAAVPTSAAGALDDFIVVLIGVIAFALAQGLPRSARVLVILAIGITLIASHAAACLFVRFYHTFPSCGILAMAGDATDARTFPSIGGGVTAGFFVTSIVAPMTLLVVSCGRSFGRRGQRYGVVTTAASTGMLPVAIFFWSALHHEHFVPAENNPLNYVLRCAVRQELAAVNGTSTSTGVMSEPALASFPALRSSRYRDGGIKEYPLFRIPAAANPQSPLPRLNIVLIVMESVRAFELGLAGTGRSVAPNIDRLAREGLTLPNFYFNGTTTARGETAIGCSVLPDSMGTIIYKSHPELSVKCLPDLLAQAGYATHWISGFDASFSHTKEFMARHGMELFHDQPGGEMRTLKGAKSSWGVSDEDLADYAVASLRGSREPFYAQIKTISNHFPWNRELFPIEEPSIAEDGERADYQGYEMGVHYTDFAIGKLLERSRGEAWFDHTLFVLLGDHGAWLFPEEVAGRSLDFLGKTEMYFRGGLVVWSPKWIRPQRILTVGSQIDLTPTLLDLLGVAAPNAFEGESLMDQRQDGRLAVMIDDNSWHVREGDRYCYALGQSCFETADPRCGVGEEPESVPHTCFEFSGDLLDFRKLPGEIRRLPEREARRLLSRGESIVRANDFMIAHERFFPPSLQADTARAGNVAGQ